ncbi:MAG: hypothetical protein M9894_06835 [Planctomycetes bacterium]|nr:hypothetical protein [Planctomycetota bacterium]
MWSKIRRAGLPALSVALLAFMGGCETDRARRRDDVRAERAPGETIEARLVNGQIQMPNVLQAGPKTITVRNESDQFHTFRIEGRDIDGGIRDPIPPGETRQFVVDLPPGQYTVKCTTPDHDQETEFALTVTEVGAGTNGQQGRNGEGTR